MQADDRNLRADIENSRATFGMEFGRMQADMANLTVGSALGNMLAHGSQPAFIMIMIMKLVSVWLMDSQTM